MPKAWGTAIAAALLACSGGEKAPSQPAPDPATLRARCTSEVASRCGELQRAEQLDCVRRETERCIRGGGSAAD